MKVCQSNKPSGCIYHFKWNGKEVARIQFLPSERQRFLSDASQGNPVWVWEGIGFIISLYLFLSIHFPQRG